MIGATLFSGGGGVEALLKEHIQFVRAVEFDPQIAAVYAQNIGNHVQVADVRQVDYSTWPRLDYLHASPVCKNFSAAKTNGTESDDDMTTTAFIVGANVPKSFKDLVLSIVIYVYELDIPSAFFISHAVHVC
jgi:DNA (cytosine-5)-methyltransferase 1